LNRRRTSLLCRTACGSLLFLAVACTLPMTASPPETTPEQTAFARTSTEQDVQTFLSELPSLPHGERLTMVSFGRTAEGREMRAVLAAEPPLAGLDAAAASDKLRILINANIHAGEVEGKEAVQMILREIALGEHQDLLQHAVLLFVPIYNIDGNERIDRSHRVTQNGPDGGVGTRANAQDLDLNRDFLKAEAPETRALIGLMDRVDPHLFLDLHTTNGSYHGYHLTYSPSLSTNVDAGIDGFARGILLPEVRARMAEEHDFRVFDYGNFSDTEQREWNTYDHRPRFGTNYVGLRNRLSVLSEAYSYFDFQTRIATTRAFVLEVLAAAVTHRQEIEALLAHADQETMNGEWAFGVDSRLGDARIQEVLVGAVQDLPLPDGLGVRHVVLPEFHGESMPTRPYFVSERHLALPEAWVVPQPSAALESLLQLHGIRFRKLAQASEPRQVASFVPSAVRHQEILFQGHHEVSLSGTWETTLLAMPAGSLVIPSSQRLARVAAQLLEPESEDSLTTWELLGPWESVQNGGASSPLWRLLPAQ